VLQESEVASHTIAELQLQLADCRVKFHSLQMQEVSNTLQLQAANDSLMHLRSINDSLKMYLSVERRMARDILAENSVLKKELAVFEETFHKQAGQLERRQEMIDMLNDKIHGLEESLMAKTGELLVAEKEVLNAQKTYAHDQTKRLQMDQQREELAILMQEGGFNSEKELVEYVKGQHEQQMLSIRALEKKVTSLEKEKKDQERMRKEAEKTLRSQKKQINNLTKKTKQNAQDELEKGVVDAAAAAAVEHGDVGRGGPAESVQGEADAGAAGVSVDTRKSKSKGRKKMVKRRVGKKTADHVQETTGAEEHE
jgi:chromosome segregation ATPase